MAKDKKSRMLSVRLEDAEVNALELTAWVEGVPVATEVRKAIELLLAEKQRSPEFKARVAAAVERAQAKLRELGEPAIADALELKPA